MSTEILETVKSIVDDTAASWQGQRDEAFPADRRVQDDVLGKLRAVLPDIDMVVMAAQEVEALAGQLAGCADEIAVDAAVKGYSFGEISTLTGLAQACTATVHQIWIDKYNPLEQRLSEVK